MSGRKSNLAKFHTITDEAMSQAEIISEVTSIEFLDNIGFQFTWTGDAEGDFAIQVSLDYDQDSFGNILSAGNWAPITLSPAPAAAGSAGSAYVDLNQLSAPWIRGVYTSTFLESGSITAVADVSGSLNSKFFTIDGADGTDWYVWFDNGTGVDPAPTGRTGVHVTYTNDDSAATLGGLIRTALASVTSIDTIAGANAVATFSQTDPGPGALADGSAATGFTLAYTTTTGVLNAWITGKML